MIPALILSFIIAAVTSGEACRADPAATSNQVHAARGVIREISADRHQAVIRHEAIPDFMPAMTMAFNVRDTNELAGLAAADTVRFVLTTTGDTHWIHGIVKVTGPANAVSPAGAKSAPPNRVPELKPGDALPDGELVAEDGRRLRFSDFRGKAPSRVAERPRRCSPLSH